MSASEVQTTPAAKLLIVDDDPTMLSQLSLALGREYQVFTAENPRLAWKLVEEHTPDLITLDLALERNDPESGFSLLEKCLEHDPHMKIVLLTGNDSQENAMRAVDQGAFDFFGKPVDLEALGHLLRRALFVGSMERRNAGLLRRIGEDGRLGAMLGKSPQMGQIFDVIHKVAPTDVSVLILGESGTGKELVARELKRLSQRATKPFVSINCGAIPDNLLESELFGHERGAYTGAHTSRPGKLEMAHSGTVFLDEIGELPPPLQVKLLRFLQEREVERVGGRTVIKIDVRVIAATNKDLASEVKAGKFREDLYYRLAVVNIRLPPLRERQPDILVMAQYFLERFAFEQHRPRLTFSRRAKQALQHYAWPGNVRELEHHVQKAVVFASGRLVHAKDLELDPENRLESLSLRQVREQTDRSTIIQALRRTCGNISKAAQELEISRPSLHDLLRKHGIDASRYKNGTMAPDEEPES